MDDVWDDKFKNKGEMWGWEPADSATQTLDLFRENKIYNILIPGLGYGRNATVFIDAEFSVSGIEISETAIEIANQHFAGKIKLHKGSVDLMPFDQELYDGIYCYALLHLLNADGRMKFIADCFNQLKPDGYMIFVSISKLDSRYGQCNEIGKDTFATWPGVNLFFYDSNSIEAEFNKYGLVNAEAFNEPLQDVNNKPSQKFWYIICKKIN